MVIYFLISFLASIVGTICGIGGGIIIKPVLDFFQLDSVSTICFLSGCTVLSMSCYSVGRSLLAKEHTVQLNTGTPLAVGAACGGIAGKLLFQVIQAGTTNQNSVGTVQSICLALITLFTLIFTVYKKRITPQNHTNKMFCVAVGFILGICSSFLGIGGGPLNLVVLEYFFDMDSKTAAANSLYIILFSQASNLIFTIVTGTIPSFAFSALILMICGGIGGGIVGRRFSQKLNNQQVDKLFLCLMAVIILICVCNVISFI